MVLARPRSASEAKRYGWPGRDRTCDIRLQRPAFYQLNYGPSRHDDADTVPRPAPTPITFPFSFCERKPERG
jgi:hypothetical protein